MTIKAPSALIAPLLGSRPYFFLFSDTTKKAALLGVYGAGSAAYRAKKSGQDVRMGTLDFDGKDFIVTLY